MKQRHDSGKGRTPTVIRRSGGGGSVAPRSGLLRPLLLLLAGGIAVAVAAVWYLGLRTAEPAPALLEDRLAKVECWFDIPSGKRVDCYRFRVPETRGLSLVPAKTDRALLLPVVIVRGDSSMGAADPVVYLAGGPGDGAWVDPDRITWWWDFIAANDWLAARDFILFDQRGSGLVEPRLDCPDAPEHALDQLARTDPVAAIAADIEAVGDCAEALKEAGYNAAAYTSADSAADLHDLFLALRLPAWNVYGLSYGTRLALEYMRGHAGDIRSVILDSVLPPDAQFYEDDAGNTDRAFQYLVRQCALNPDCHGAYPDLGARLLALVQRLNKTPLVVSRPHPDDRGRKVVIAMNGQRLIYRLFNLLYNRADIEQVPWLIDAYDRNLRHRIDADLSSYLLETSGREDFGEAMFMSVQCFEEAPFNDLRKASEAYKSYPLLQGLEFGGEATIYAASCQVWRDAFGVDGVRASDHAPVESALPVLILTGSYDPVTPPAYARLAARGLPNSFLFEFAHYGHDVLGNDSCANTIAAEFLADPATRPAPRCLQHQLPPSFWPPDGPLQ